VGHFDDMIQLPGLFFHLRRQEDRRCGHIVPMEVSEGMVHVESMHVHDRRVDAQLVPIQKTIH
jgi:alpha-acetolactate decarboxylase